MSVPVSVHHINPAHTYIYKFSQNWDFYLVCRFRWEESIVSRIGKTFPAHNSGCRLVCWLCYHWKWLYLWSYKIAFWTSVVLSCFTWGSS